jgi:hypothetical protein
MPRRIRASLVIAGCPAGADLEAGEPLLAELDLGIGHVDVGACRSEPHLDLAQAASRPMRRL